MHRTQTILTTLGAGFALLLSPFASNAVVKLAPKPGQFEIVTSGDGTRAWRINTLSGEILYCSPQDDSKQPVCTPVETPAQRDEKPSTKY